MEEGGVCSYIYLGVPAIEGVQSDDKSRLAAVAAAGFVGLTRKWDFSWLFVYDCVVLLGACECVL